MKIDSKIIADVLSGQVRHDAVDIGGRALSQAIQKDARLPELLWYLEVVSKFICQESAT